MVERISAEMGKDAPRLAPEALRALAKGGWELQAGPAGQDS